jgi:uncharacterized protein YegP (UPF0339 family)
LVPATYLLSKTGDQEYSFVLRGENKEPILMSQTYRTKAGAQGGIQSVRDNSTDDACYERRLAPDGTHFFILKTPDGEPLGQSKTYPYPDALDRVVALVKRVARRALVEESL